MNFAAVVLLGSSPDEQLLPRRLGRDSGERAVPDDFDVYRSVYASGRSEVPSVT